MLAAAALVGGALAPASEGSLPQAAELSDYWQEGSLSRLTQDEMLHRVVRLRPCWQLSRKLWWVRGGGVMSFARLPLSDVLVEWEEYEIQANERQSPDEVVGLRPARVTGVLFKEFAADKSAGDAPPDMSRGRMAKEEIRSIFPLLKSYFYNLERKGARHVEGKTLWSTKRGAVALKGWGGEGARPFNKLYAGDCYFITLTLMPENKRKPVSEKKTAAYSRQLLAERLKECKCSRSSKFLGRVDVALTLAFVETLLGRNVSGVMEMERKVRSWDCPAGEKGLRVLSKLSPKAHWLRLYKPGEAAEYESLPSGEQNLPPILAEVYKQIDEAPLLWLVADAASEGGAGPRACLRLVVDYDLKEQTISWVEFHESGLLRGVTPAAEALRISVCAPAEPSH